MIVDEPMSRRDIYIGSHKNYGRILPWLKANNVIWNNGAKLEDFIPNGEQVRLIIHHYGRESRLTFNPDFRYPERCENLDDILEEYRLENNPPDVSEESFENILMSSK